MFVRAWCAVALAVLGGNAASLPAKHLIGHYDFGYAMRGDRLARPAQVFDDGAGKIYFQARPGVAMPAVFFGKDLQLLVLQPEGQYYTARTSANEFTLAIGGARASVQRGESPVAADAAGGRVESGRLLASAESGLPSGIDFGDGRAELDAKAAVAAASPSMSFADHVPATDLVSSLPHPPFDIVAADRDIAVSLRRWAHASGYQIAWDVRWVAPVNGALHVEAPSFLEAVRQVVAGLRAQGYPVRAEAFADRVVRFTATE